MRAYDVEARLQPPLFTAREANKKALHGQRFFLKPIQGSLGP
jgi:hypothetical protein